MPNGLSLEYSERIMKPPKEDTLPGLLEMQQKSPKILKSSIFDSTQ